MKGLPLALLLLNGCAVNIEHGAGWWSFTATAFKEPKIEQLHVTAKGVGVRGYDGIPDSAGAGAFAGTVVGAAVKALVKP